MDLPECFCWTRFGTEAGQGIEQILRRKDEERLANNGVFLWGIGNSVGAAIDELARRCGNPEVLFSPIKTSARPADATPESVVAWTKAETVHGQEFLLPTHSLVTSRQNVSVPKLTHYALVCFSETPLTLASSPLTFSFGAIRNMVSGNPVGASQVTAVVRAHVGPASDGGIYKISLRARLAPPYFVRLREPRPIPNSARSTKDWETAVHSNWQQRISFA
jgi:hypothetical protein